MYYVIVHIFINNNNHNNNVFVEPKDIANIKASNLCPYAKLIM